MIHTLRTTRLSATASSCAAAGVAKLRQDRLELLHAGALLRDLRVAVLRRIEQRRRQLLADPGAQLAHQHLRQVALRVERQPHAEAEFRVVLEQAVRPRRALALGVARPRRGRQVAAVDRRATGGVGDDQAIAVQLRDQLEVGRLAAARARARVFEQRHAQLRAAQSVDRVERAVAPRAGSGRTRSSRARLRGARAWAPC